jgi:hypothetical protein
MRMVWGGRSSLILGGFLMGILARKPGVAFTTGVRLLLMI